MRYIAYTYHMMSDKFTQQLFDATHSRHDTLANDGSLTAIPRLNRSGATMEAIKAYILSHNLTPGSPLPTESELCAELGVSRSSVREALRKLEALDIVFVHQGRGTFVSDMSLLPMVETLTLRTSLSNNDAIHNLHEVVSLRKYLDLGMAADICAAFQGTHHQELHDIVNVMIHKAEHDEDFLAEDNAFHAGMLHIIGNRVAEQMVSALWLVHQVVVPKLRKTDTQIDTARAHAAILTGAESGDRASYRKAVKKHYKFIELTLTQIIEEGKEH